MDKNYVNNDNNKSLVSEKNDFEDRLKLTSNIVKYDFKDIHIQTNKGNLKISYEDVFQIVYAFLDGTSSLTSEVNEILAKIANDYEIEY